MMNIDDFVRERLGAPSEKEDPNAWLKMKALLDEEMPERAVPFYFRLRKPLTFIGAALLLGTLCVGGYHLNAIRSRQAGSPGGSAAETSTTNIGAANNNANNTIAPSNTNNTAPDNKPVPTATVTSDHSMTREAVTPNSSARHRPSVSAQNIRVQDDLKIQQDRLPATAKLTRSASVNPTPEHTSNKTKSPDQSVDTQEQLAQQQVKDALASVTAPDNIKGKKATADDNATSNPRDSKAKTAAHGNRKGVQLKSATGADRQDIPKSESLTVAAASGGTANIPAGKEISGSSTSGKNGGFDSMNTVSIVNKPVIKDRRSKEVSFKTDTIQESKIAVPQSPSAQTPAAGNSYAIGDINNIPDKDALKQASKADKKSNKVLSRAEAKRQDELFNGAPPKGLATPTANTAASAEKTTGTVSGKQKNALARFVEKLDLPGKKEEVKRGFHNAEYYAGFSLGGNYSLSSLNDFRGIQFGPTGEIVFNKHWSFFAALRYFNRSGANRQVNDNYSKEVSSNVPDSIRGSNYYFTIFTDSTSRHFTFSTVQSLELPLTVRYAFRNFYLMTGMNVVFTLPVNIELYEKNEGIQSSRVVPTNSTNKPILGESGNSYSTKDFGGRLGLGYIVGAGYRFAPAWHADLQLTNTFWDASGNASSKQISKDFFRIPSVQFSIGFQFNRGNKRPTFGPADNQIK